jgi:hypothetical protein
MRSGLTIDPRLESTRHFSEAKDQFDLPLLQAGGGADVEDGLARILELVHLIVERVGGPRGRGRLRPGEPGGGGSTQERFEFLLLLVAIQEKLMEQSDLRVQAGDLFAGEILDLGEEPLELLSRTQGGISEGAGSIAGGRGAPAAEARKHHGKEEHRDQEHDEENAILGAGGSGSRSAGGALHRRGYRVEDLHLEGIIASGEKEGTNKIEEWIPVSRA